MRYAGSSLTFDFAGIFAASFAPCVATWLVRSDGSSSLSAAVALTQLGLVTTRETFGERLA